MEFRVKANLTALCVQKWLATERARCMDLVVGVERTLRELLSPTKVNLASLGNMVPHLHWHVIARFDWDGRFPAPVWAAAQRPPDAGRIAAVVAVRASLEEALAQALAATP